MASERKKHDILTKNKYPKVMDACLRIVTKENRGTGFILKHKNKFYLVTAAHLATSARSTNKMTVAIKCDDNLRCANEQLKWYQADVYFHCYNDIDICILSLPQGYEITSYLEYKNQAVVIGEECFMVGFPSSLGILYEKNHGQLMMAPAIRKGIVAHVGSTADASYLMLDMIVGSGFSGSPVVVFDKKNRPYVIGIVAGGAREASSVVDGNGKNSGMYTYNLTGFTQAFHISYALEIIDKIK